KKKQKKNTAFLNFAVWMFMISATLYLASSIFLRTYNNSLSAQTQQMEADIATLHTQNDALKVEILNLGSNIRVDEIAANNGLSKKQENIVTITGGTGNTTGE
ncbi:MAG: hypothetical protein SPI63_02720, partial [Bulleidia sp.]|nr:hypothetical protein [Bulleidia sp.]